MLATTDRECLRHCSVAFAGTEFIGRAAAESDNPRKYIPTAIKQVFWRITLLGILLQVALHGEPFLLP